MLRLLIVLLAVTCFSPFICSGQSDSTVIATEYAYFDLPDKRIGILRSIYEKPNLSFLVLHDDENTGLNAAKAFCRSNGGSLTELQYGNVRNISFGGQPPRYAFDPNQIFNNMGLEKSLKKYSIGKTVEGTVKRARGLALSLFEVYKPDSLGYIITLHNNTDENFGIQSYQPGGYLFGVADSIYVNPEMDTDDLIFVTEPIFFDYLKQQNINTVLQSVSALDGSLSVYAQMNKIPYINIEVQHGHDEEHLHLIYVVEQMFKTVRFNEFYAKGK